MLNVPGIMPQPEQPIATFPQVNPTDLPFVWGGGGQRLSPDDIDAKRRIAQALMAQGTDYSPVGSWAQGLARVAQGVLGGFEERDLDKSAATNAAESQDVVAKLLAGGGTGTAPLAALANPNLDGGTKDIAKLLYERNNPAAKAPNADQQLMMDAGYVPGTPEWKAKAGGILDRKGDPLVSVTLPGGRFYNGPQSGLMAALTGGGGQPSGAPGTASPAAPPPDAIAHLRANPGTASDFDAIFGQGASARALGAGGPMPSASGTFSMSALDAATVGSESNGRRYGKDGGLLRSGVGAMGEWQVMPSTARDPGFGIKPWDGSNPDDLARVGRDYRVAMQQRYGGDLGKMWGAYNWGPGNVDSAIASRGDNWLSGAPRETQDYIRRNFGAVRGR